MYNDKDCRYLTSALEYETLVMLGSNLGIDDLDAIAEMDRLCDDFGLDTIEIGGAIGVAMEAKVVTFGDARGAIDLLKEIPKGTPLGRIIGNGVEITGKVFGVSRVPSVKGQGMSGYDPRAMKGIGVTYMSSPMGADHTAACVLPGRTGFDPKETVDVLKPEGQAQVSSELQIIIAVLDAMGLCFFIGPTVQNLDVLANLHRAKYGSKMTVDELVNLGKDILRTEKDFNNKAGIASVNHLPDFFQKEPLPPHNTVFDVSFQEVVDMGAKYETLR
jgi:aldehyde:ferredoxin oxidoreductase